LRWIANRNIKAGEQFNDTGIDAPFMAICLLHDNLGERAKHYGGCCVDFPTSPAQTPEKCGYYWVEEN